MVVKSDRFDIKPASMVGMSRFGRLIGPLSLAALFAAGCGQRVETPTPQIAQAAPQAKTLPPPKLETAVDAGVPLAASNDMNRWKNLIAARTYKPRKDPFALSNDEVNFEARQQSERLVLDQGGFTNFFEPVVEAQAPPPVVEPQPADRRLAGVLVGDSILAIIEMGNGRPAEIVRPGQTIPRTNWTVVSIDADKAVLRRGGNVLPHEVVVRLQSRGVSAPRPAATPQPGAPAGPGGGGPARPGGGGNAGGGRGGRGG